MNPIPRQSALAAALRTRLEANASGFDKLLPARSLQPVEKSNLLRDVIPAGKGRVETEEYLRRVRRGQDCGMKSLLMLLNRHKGKTCCIVGGGPSLQTSVGELRRMAKRGAIIIGVNKSHDWLLQRGLPCHYAVLLDPKEWVADYIDLALVDRARKGKRFVEPSYLIASQCHDAVIEKFLHHERAFMWHAGAGLGESEILKTEYKSALWVSIAGASVVGLRAVGVANGLGLSDIHLFGIDGSARMPSERDARRIYDALLAAGLAREGAPTFAEIMGMVFGIAARKTKALPASVQDVLKKHLYSYAKPNIDATWKGFTVDLNSGWSRQFMSNHHMARAVYEFEDSMRDWDRQIIEGRMTPFSVRVHGDPELSATAMVAAAMGVHADEFENEKYGKPPVKRAA